MGPGDDGLRMPDSQLQPPACPSLALLAHARSESDAPASPEPAASQCPPFACKWPAGRPPCASRGRHAGRPSSGHWRDHACCLAPFRARLSAAASTRPTTLVRPPGAPFGAAERAILAAAYRHVPEHGFSPRTLALGARDAGYPDISASILPDGAFSLVGGTW